VRKCRDSKPSRIRGVIAGDSKRERAWNTGCEHMVNFPVKRRNAVGKKKALPSPKRKNSKAWPKSPNHPTGMFSPEERRREHLKAKRISVLQGKRGDARKAGARTETGKSWGGGGARTHRKKMNHNKTVITKSDSK